MVVGMVMCCINGLALSGCTWFGLIALGVIVVLTIVVLVPHNLRVRRVREAYRAVPGEVREEVIRLIERAAAGGEAFTFYVRGTEGEEGDTHLGGLPWCNPGEVPPGEAKHLLIQVRIEEPSLGAVWQGRIVQVFLTEDWQTPVRSAAGKLPGGDEKGVPAPLARTGLRTIRMPLPPEPTEEEDEEDGLGNPAWLVEHVPGLRGLLEQYHSDAAGLLAQVLGPDVFGYTITEPDMVYAGGRPLLIQNPHEARCEVCGRPMRFLLQFGDLVQGVQLGDAGVCYVYGCDEHPERCLAFVDSH